MKTKRYFKHRFLAPEVKLCPLQIACEGTYLHKDRKVCVQCEAAQRRGRSRVIPPRGERYMQYAEARRKA